MTGDRRVGVAMDFSPCSKAALRWATENLIRDGDHLIIVNVQKEVSYEGGETQLWEATGSRDFRMRVFGLKILECSIKFQDTVIEATHNGAPPLLSADCHHLLLALIPLSELSDPTVLKKYGVRTDAEALDILNTVARQKQAIVVMKIYWGDAREKICEAIDNIPLSCLIIGNRGLSKIKRVFMGSVSNFVVNNSTCPVTVVKSAEHEA